MKIVLFRSPELKKCMTNNDHVRGYMSLYNLADDIFVSCAKNGEMAILSMIDDMFYNANSKADKEASREVCMGINHWTKGATTVDI